MGVVNVMWTSLFFVLQHFGQSVRLYYSGGHQISLMWIRLLIFIGSFQYLFTGGNIWDSAIKDVSKCIKHVVWRSVQADNPFP